MFVFLVVFKVNTLGAYTCINVVGIVSFFIIYFAEMVYIFDVGYFVVSR